VDGKVGLISTVSKLQERLNKVELSFTNRIGPLNIDENSEKKRSFWKKKKSTLMMVAASAAKKAAELAAHEAEIELKRKKLKELEEREAEEKAKKEKDATEELDEAEKAARKKAEEDEAEDVKKERLEKEKILAEEKEKERLEAEAIRAEMAAMESKILESQAALAKAMEEKSMIEQENASLEEPEDPDDSYNGPSMIEMIREIESNLKVKDVEHDEALDTLKNELKSVASNTKKQVEALEKAMKRMPKPAKMAPAPVAPAPADGSAPAAATVAEEQPMMMESTGVDMDVIVELEERLERIENDFDELGAVAENIENLTESKLESAVFGSHVKDIMDWRMMCDAAIKANKEALKDAEERALEAESVEAYDDTKITTALQQTGELLETKKFDREEAYGLEQGLNAELDGIKEELDKNKALLDDLLNGDDKVDQVALDTLAAAMKAKMMAMGNAFHKRFEDLEEQLLGVGSSATRSSLGLCLSCSRPTATVDHVDHAPNPSPGAKGPQSRPSSRQGAPSQRYFHKPALYSNTFESTEDALLAAANESPGGHASNRSRTHTPHHGERPGGLASLGRPVDGGSKQIADHNSFNLSGISAASPVLDAPFQGRPGSRQGHVSKMRQETHQSSPNYGGYHLQ